MVPLQGDDGRSGSLSARHSRGRHRGDLRSARANEHLNARVISTDHVPWPSGFLVTITRLACPRTFLFAYDHISTRERIPRSDLV